MDRMIWACWAGSTSAWSIKIQKDSLVGVLHDEVFSAVAPLSPLDERNRVYAEAVTAGVTEGKLQTHGHQTQVSVAELVAITEVQRLSVATWFP